jgi:hypothetical protein
MKRSIQVFTIFLVILAISCNKEKAQPLQDVPFLKDDLVGAWQGYYPIFNVAATNAAPKLDLVNARTSMILQTENYWFEITYYSDTLEYSFISQGFWSWFENAPHAILFEMTQDRTRKIRKRPRTGTDSTIAADSVLWQETTANGDGSAILQTWYTNFEFVGADSLKLSNIGGDLTLPDIALSRR